MKKYAFVKINEVFYVAVQSFDYLNKTITLMDTSNVPHIYHFENNDNRLSEILNEFFKKYKFKDFYYTIDEVELLNAI